ncbi:MAG: CRISPR-associated endonuclease Cas1 [Cyanobacteriota bacterium]
MRTLYVSQQGCYVSLKQESVVIKRGNIILETAQLPLLEQILIFGKSQVTTQVMRACLRRNIPIAYLSRMGYCYGRLIPIERGYRQLSRYQQQLSWVEQLLVAQAIVAAKIGNARVILLRQQRRRPSEAIAQSIDQLHHFAQQVRQADSTERLMGLEGAAAASYFAAFGDCIEHPDFAFVARSRRPPGNPVNAMLSFGYQVLWNHLLSLIELQELDPYYACLHQSSDRHAALASDLIEEFRAPLIDSLTLYLINRRMIHAQNDFEYRNGGCFLNESGRKIFLQAFLQRMEERLQTDDGNQPRWDLLTQQVRAFKQFVYSPAQGYRPYEIR